MKTAILVPLVVLGLLVPARPVPAAMMAYVYTGRVTEAWDPSHHLDGSIKAGGSMSGSYTFESTMTDDKPDDPRWGIYTIPTPPSSVMTLSMGNYAFTSTSDRIAVGDNVPKDQLNLYSYDFEGYGVRFEYMAVYMFDYYGQAFSSDALPLTPESLLGLAGGTFVISGRTLDGDQPVSLQGLILSFRVVPEPSGLSMFFLGVMACLRAATGGRSRGRRSA